MLFRFGGEEFVVILEPTAEADAKRALDRLREAVERYQFPRLRTLSVSIGFARLTERDYPPMVLEHADQTLYYAKEKGRHQCNSYQTLIAEGNPTARAAPGTFELF